jgi:uncharacterized protein (TIGR03435 family)
MTLDTFLAHPSVQALGWALLHFIWQGALLALLLWIVRAFAPSSAARLRYAAASLIMLMMPIALVVTAKQGFVRKAERNQTVNLASAAANQSVIQPPLPQPQDILYAPTSSSAPSPGIPGWAVCIWFIGVLLLSVRAAGGWIAAHRLKRGATHISAELEGTIGRLKRKLRVSAPVRLCTSAMVRVPLVIGWLRPYILLPVEALTGLSEPQIEAILAHELAHIRRHDYLLNLLQTAIETVLFYHPAVWWVGKQMRLERENCCDDLAVAVCGNVLEYAGALAELEAIRGGVPEPALAASGGELLGRIQRLLGKANNAGRDRSPTSLGTIAAVALVLLMAGAGAMVSLHAQPAPGKPEFEVATVRQNKSGPPENPRFPGDGQGALLPGGQLTMRNQTLRTLLGFAFNPGNQRFRDDLIVGAPSWVDSDRFDVVAKAPSSVPPRQCFFSGYCYPDKALAAMLQTLLQKEFKIAYHQEQRPANVYSLVAAKGGPKLRRSAAPGDRLCKRITGDMADPDAKGLLSIEAGFICANMTMADFADLLPEMGPAYLDRVVVNGTGLEGTYDFRLVWVGAANIDQGGLTLFDALEKQLGLKLETRKVPITVTVIDRIEKLDSEQ